VVYKLGEELEKLTWRILDPVVPQLRQSLFPKPSSESKEVV